MKRSVARVHPITLLSLRAAERMLNQVHRGMARVGVIGIYTITIFTI